MILITGARGVIGQPLCWRLATSADGYLAVSRAAEGAVQTLQWDLNDSLSEKHLRKISACTKIIHCAPLWLLPKHFSSLAKAGINQMVAFSSTSVIAKKSSTDHHDISLVKTLEEAEQNLTRLAGEHGVALTILRPSMIYGNGLDENISHIARKIKRLKIMPLAGQAQGLRQPVHAEDLVDAAIAVLERRSSGIKIYNLGGGDILSYRAMVVKIFQALGIKPRFMVIPLWFFRVLLRVLSLFSSFDYTASMADRMNVDLVYDHNAASIDFGYQPQGFLLHPERDLPL